jgi:hypothetical protein
MTPNSAHKKFEKMLKINGVEGGLKPAENSYQAS